MAKNTTYSLLEFNNLIKETIENNFFDYISITAEINNITVNRTGHCYLELIQKDEFSDKILAKTRATIWAPNYRMLAPYFESVTGKQLSEGIKILFKADVNFHEVFGFSINIIDIDPNYTLGDIERQKQETIKQLETDGVIEMNKELEIQPIIKKIAIISSNTAAGYEDFINQLENNPYNFKFHYKLFEAYMQGNNAEDSIIEAFNRIFEYSDFFDVVVLIRGGGAKSDLTVFDSYNIAYYITQFPIPVVTGIGHERDNSVADIVANTQVKTPTAAAEFIINNNNSFKEYLFELAENIKYNTEEIIDNENNYLEKTLTKYLNLSENIISENKYYLSQLANSFKSNVSINSEKELNKLNNIAIKTKYISESFCSARLNNINRLTRRLTNISSNYIIAKNNEINIAELKLESNNPDKLIEKGYSYITLNNKIVKSIDKIKKGDKITNMLKDGEIISVVSKFDRK